MNSKLKTKGACLLLCLTISVGTLAGCTASNTTPPTSPNTKTQAPQTSPDTALNKNSRAEYEAQLAEIKERYKQNPDDRDIAFQYSKILYTLGNFDEARKVLTPCLNAGNPSPDVIYLSAQLKYLDGDYAGAEALYKSLVNEYYDDYGLAAEAGLQMVYYQTNAYHKAKELFIGQDLENPLLDMMNAFDKTPYQLHWNGYAQTTIPFVTTDPLPVIPIEINGVKINAFIDTGAGMPIIEQAFASDLGIESVSSTVGGGTGGAADIGFGKADSIKLGEVDILNIPVTIASFDGFKNIFDGYATDVHAIIGTNILQQFIPVMDYPSGQLVLVPRDKSGHKQLTAKLAGENVLEKIPFALASTHFMFAKGSINGYAGLNMFVDSGLDDSKGAGIMLSKETMDLLNIPMPELEQVAEGMGGIGGSDYKKSWFDLSSYGLGNLQVKDAIGLYNTSDILSPFMGNVGFIGDALISHNYLKQYKWIIDFDAMTMMFCE